jgi:hypothetical protein
MRSELVTERVRQIPPKDGFVRLAGAHALYQRGVTNQNANWTDDDAPAI